MFGMPYGLMAELLSSVLKKLSCSIRQMANRRTLVELKTSIRHGQLLYDSTSKSLIYRGEIEDPQAVFGFGILLGIYNIDQQINHEIPLRIIEGLPYHILGFDADTQALYLLQIGNDPGWDRIWIYNLDDGQLIVRPGTRGDDQLPILSPDFNFLATTLFDDASNTGSINVYTIAQPEATPQRFPLPDPPSHFSAISWSPDGRFIYFLLKDERIFAEGTRSYGIWSVDIANGKMHQISTTSKNWRTWYQLDSQWVILFPPIDRIAVMVNLLNGHEFEFPLPVDDGLVVHSTGH